MVTAMNVSNEVRQLLQPYDFEMSQDMRPFLEEYWTASFLIALIYLLLIVVGQNYMRARKGFSLQWPLMLWSFCLAVFSVLGAVRTWGYMGTVLLRGGLKQTVCFSDYIEHSTIKFWSCLFLLSKIVELVAELTRASRRSRPPTCQLSSLRPRGGVAAPPLADASQAAGPPRLRAPGCSWNPRVPGLPSPGAKGWGGGHWLPVSLNPHLIPVHPALS
nr:elongation of very long chain fatty acids protein 3 isoform X2 [Oryctolagus cuniculus]